MLDDGVWFIYDGECPLCTRTALAFRIKQEFGAIHLLDARSDPNHTLLAQVTQRDLDLDAGMVIIADGIFYHGQDALHFMAQHGDRENLFTMFVTTIFRSSSAAKAVYPWLRVGRNWLLRLKKVGPINNLDPKR